MKIDLVEKYIGEIKFSDYKEPEGFQSSKDLADTWIEYGKRGLMSGKQKEVTLALANAIKKGDKRKAKKILDTQIDYVFGGQGQVNNVLAWLRGQVK
jgi:hypothetical protein